MIGNDQIGATAWMHASAQRSQRRFEPKQVQRRGSAQGNQYLGTNHIDLLKQEGRASVSLLRLGNAILRGPAFDDIRDINLFALQTHGGNHVVEQLAGAADEWKSLGIFVGAWPLAHKHQSSVRITIAKNDLVAASGKSAPGAIADLLVYGEQRFGTALRRNDSALRRLRRKRGAWWNG